MFVRCGIFSFNYLITTNISRHINLLQKANLLFSNVATFSPSAKENHICFKMKIIPLSWLPFTDCFANADSVSEMYGELIRHQVVMISFEITWALKRENNEVAFNHDTSQSVLLFPSRYFFHLSFQQTLLMYAIYSEKLISVKAREMKRGTFYGAIRKQKRGKKSCLPKKFT